MGLAKRAASGFLAGAVATVPMTGEFWLAHRARLIDELPPHKAIRSATSDLDEPQLSLVAGIAHLMIGGAAGAIYGAVVPSRLRGALSGAAFGLAVWATGYEIVMPTATEMPPAHRDDRRRVGTIFVAHIVYGAALGTGLGAIRRLSATPARRARKWIRSV
jgi:hypothetical protein